MQRKSQGIEDRNSCQYGAKKKAVRFQGFFLRAALSGDGVGPCAAGFSEGTVGWAGEAEKESFRGDSWTLGLSARGNLREERSDHRPPFGNVMVRFGLATLMMG